MNLEEIKKRYAEPHRHYHTWEHIEYMFRIAKENGVEVKENSPLWYAIVYHDIVYDPKATNNEEKSVKLFIKDKMLENPSDELRLMALHYVGNVIKATKTHKVNFSFYDASLIEHQKQIVDLDLAILGDTPEVYQDYVNKVRKEYSFATDEEWKKGRSDCLIQMIERENIYYTDWGKKREDQAMRNMMNEMEELGFKDFPFLPSQRI